MLEKKTENQEEKFFCKVCNYTAGRKGDLNKHKITQKHIKKSLSNEYTENNTEKNGENNKKYNCFICDFYTSDKMDYNRHLMTRKHKKKQDDFKKYEDVPQNETNYKELLMLALQENKEMREFMIKQHETIEKQHSTINEIIPKIGSTTNNINSNNSFNLNFFLNEQCKNAITMDEFMNKIEVSLSNLFYTREKGIAEGLSNIFIENMNKLPITERPIHCTDVKRETIYIKNEKWEKDEDQVQTKEAIKKLSNIQIKNLSKYKEEYPDCMKIDKQKDTYMEIIKATTDDVDDKEGKIIKNVCKNVYVKNDILQK